MGRKKDGVDILINAFNIFHENNPKFKLYLIGYTNDITEEKELKQLISILKLNTAIVLTGKVKRDDMPKFLTNATILALARPESKQAEAGFPTKLGEYLATGNPVVVTSVGEIENYLTHGVNAFICKPGNIRDFAEKLDFIAKNQSFAKKVGIEGRKLAETVFNYKKQAINIITFINKIKNNE
jgi:glycosyltransferase involved in cell wall biosynthesis